MTTAAVRLTPAVKQLLARSEPRLKERLFRSPEALQRFADRFHREEHRFGFTWLLGESHTWSGDPLVIIGGERFCSICWGLPLPRHAYCLGCDRCGRELEVPGPGPLVPRRISAKVAGGNLGGGTGRPGPIVPPKVEDEPGTGKPRWVMPWASRRPLRR